MDKELWGDPENFRPERFIEDGQLKVSLDKSLPFGAGIVGAANFLLIIQLIFYYIYIISLSRIRICNCFLNKLNKLET